MSFWPWIIKVGADTVLIYDKLSKRSLTSMEAIEPSNVRVADLRLVYGEIRISAAMD